MLKIVRDFNRYPPSVKKAVVLTAGAWVWFYISLVLMDRSSDTFVIERRFLMIGVCMLALLASMKNWARLVCLMGNVMAALFFIFSVVVLIKLKLIVTFLTIEIVLLLLSSIYLAIRPSAQFFREYNLKPEPGEGT
ncbi:MAG: hypothetical protein LJE94_01315 [Deltaproteobacteria bacterium]|nr:hypothetical protein [Deltaproteobacteria bacterium]